MAEAVDPIRLTSWAGGRGFVDMYYDDATTDATRFVCANGTPEAPTRSGAYLRVYDKRGRLVEVIAGTGYTILLQPGESREFAAPPNLNLAADGSLNGWRLDSTGPAR